MHCIGKCPQPLTSCQNAGVESTNSAPQTQQATIAVRGPAGGPARSTGPSGNQILV
jgi:hypothetical protein